MSIFILAGCVAVVALAAAFAGYTIGAGRASGDAVPAAAPMLEDAAPGSALPEPVLPSIQIIEPPIPAGSIAVPGFERLTAEGRTLNAGAITNPSQNTCYFIITLIMPGGAELYRSSYLAPGQSLGDVEMLVPLVPETYRGVFARYSCYALDDLKPLNGADIEFVLEVRP